MPRIDKKHLLATRWLHWINFPLLAMMIWSGMLVYWANPVYGIRLGSYELFHFFPAGFYDLLGIPYRLAEGLQLHFFFMWLFTLNGLAYVLFLIFSGEWRSIVPVPGSLRRAGVVALHDLRLTKRLPPQGKYNDAQRIAYTGVILMGAGSVLTGLAIYKPLQLAWLTWLMGGYEWARWLHFWLMIAFVAFFVLHVVQVVLAGWKNFRSMITGREITADVKTPAAGTALVLNEPRRLSEPLEDQEASKRMKRYTRRNFLIGGAATVAVLRSWSMIDPETWDGFYRGVFRFNERLSRTLYSNGRLAPEFSPAAISPRRVNGALGLRGEIDAATWRLAIGGIAGRTDDLVLSLDQITAMPRTEMITELKCIEGWSVIVHWAGVRFSDLAAAIGASQLPEYVGLSTPDNEYFVGWDIESLMHPQTLLAYEMNGAPLLPEHGAPLRLASTTKYGIKLLKRIGRINFTAERPRDYWAESGYDWYSGH